jgi:hypothetical protein
MGCYSYQKAKVDRVAIDFARVIDFPYLFLYIRREMRGAASDKSGYAGASKETIGTLECNANL